MIFSLPKRSATASRRRSSGAGALGSRTARAAGARRRSARCRSRRAARGGRGAPRRTAPTPSRTGSSPSRVASRSVRACVVVRKSSSRYFSVTVRARRPCLRRRAATMSASSSSVARRRAPVGRVPVVGVLLAEALRLPRLGAHRPLVLAAREPLQVVAVRAEPPRQPLRVEGGQVADRHDAELRELLLQLRPDAPQPAHGERGEERRLGARAAPPPGRPACACPRRPWPRASTWRRRPTP